MLRSELRELIDNWLRERGMSADEAAERLRRMRMRDLREQIARDPDRFAEKYMEMLDLLTALLIKGGGDEHEGAEGFSPIFAEQMRQRSRNYVLHVLSRLEEDDADVR